MATRPPTTSKVRGVKKHVGAIHIKGRLTLLQRKLANALLQNAYHELMERERHSIRISVLMDRVGFGSTNRQKLHTAVKALMDVKIEWNILDEHGHKEWGASVLLASAKIARGTCEYAYAYHLREKLHHPEIYVRINLEVQKQFRRGYALALYENCLRYHTVGSTGWQSVAVWRELLGATRTYYEDFRRFSQEVLKPAIAEINSLSDITVTMERKREARRVVALRFLVEKALNPLLVDTPPSKLPNPSYEQPEDHSIAALLAAEGWQNISQC